MSLVSDDGIAGAADQPGLTDCNGIPAQLETEIADSGAAVQ